MAEYHITLVGGDLDDARPAGSSQGTANARGKL
jgi:hypothetical protein